MHSQKLGKIESLTTVNISIFSQQKFHRFTVRTKGQSDLLYDDVKWTSPLRTYLHNTFVVVCGCHSDVGKMVQMPDFFSLIAKFGTFMHVYSNYTVHTVE